MDPMNLSTILGELSSRASRYSINLHGQIELDHGKDPLRGGTAWVYRGTLRQGGAKVAVKAIHLGPSGDMESLKVILGSHAAVCVDSLPCSAFSGRCTYGPN